MAMPRKGTRLITVDDVQYRWLIRRRPTYSQGICETPMTVAVELADRPASVALLVLPHAHPSNWMCAPVAPVRPATVADGICTALAQGWNPCHQGDCEVPVEGSDNLV